MKQKKELKKFLVDMAREKAMSKIKKLKQVGTLAQVAGDHKTVISPDEIGGDI